MEGPPLLLHDYGYIGESFAIEEEDLLEVIYRRLKALAQEGSLKAHQEIIVQKVLSRIQSPEPVKGLTRTIVSRQFFYDPSVEVDDDLYDHQGRRIHKKGTRINPKVSWKKTLLFLDGDDPDQVAWAVSHGPDPQTIWILVKGSPFRMMERQNRRIFFDQGGVLTQKFGFEHVPVRVSQKDDRILVEECVCEEGKSP
jgi:conjugal transfer pilus assembly protein TraW